MSTVKNSGSYVPDAVYISFGVPQSSILGPILFTLYTAPLSYVIAEHEVEHHLYATSNDT